jgi:hypothetical protein
MMKRQRQRVASMAAGVGQWQWRKLAAAGNPQRRNVGGVMSAEKCSERQSGQPPLAMWRKANIGINRRLASSVAWLSALIIK